MIKIVRTDDKRTEIHIFQRNGQEYVSSKSFTIEYLEIKLVWEWMTKKIPCKKITLRPFDKLNSVSITVKERMKDNKGKWKFIANESRTIYGYSFEEIMAFITEGS